jgi:signal transduction histidine kinase
MTVQHAHSKNNSIKVGDKLPVEDKTSKTIEAKIHINGELFGKLAFVSADKRDFNSGDKDFVRLMASWISATLERYEIDKMKSEFVSLASHQMNTPLSIINWYSDVLLNDDARPLTAEQKKYVVGIAEASARMVELISTLLNVSRIEMGTIAVSPVPTKLEDTAKSMLRELQHQIDMKKLKVVAEFEPDIPKVPADPNLLRIVFQNLLTNAIKYNKEGVKLFIRIMRLPKYKNMVYFEVGDTGMGIPDKDKPKIFQKLFRADNARKKINDGNGLGLYIIKSIIEASGGKIWFESEENKGTMFSFILPLTGMKPKMINFSSNPDLF